MTPHTAPEPLPSVPPQTTEAPAAHTAHKRGPLARRLDARWRRRVDYPSAETRYRPSGDIDLLRNMRLLIRLTGGLLLAFVLMVTLALAGVDLPTNLHLLFIVPAVAVMCASTPNMTSVLLWQVRPRWANRWLDAGVRLTDLHLLARSPLPPAQVHAYASALGTVPDLGVDVRLVWALHERGITPPTLAAYITQTVDSAIANTLLPADTDRDEIARYMWRPDADVRQSIKVILPTVEDVLHIAAHYTPEEWVTIRQANAYSSVVNLVRLADWMGTSRATLNPAQFPHEDTLPARDVSTVATTLTAWMPHVDDVRLPDLRELCPESGPAAGTRCPTCGTSNSHDHRTYLAHPNRIRVYATGSSTMAGRHLTLHDWATACGHLAPHFITGGFDYDTATRMCTGPTPPTVEAIQTLAALRADPL